MRVMNVLQSKGFGSLVLSLFANLPFGVVELKIIVA